MALKRLGNRALNVRDIAPKNGDEAFQLRSEINHPVTSKNKKDLVIVKEENGHFQEEQKLKFYLRLDVKKHALKHYLS